MKRRAIGLAALLTAAALAGCAENGTAQIAGTDYRIKPDFVYDTAGKEITESTMLIADYAFKPSLTNLSENSQYIVKGTVEEIHYTTLDGDPYMQLDVIINEACSGELAEGDAVSVYAMGGYNLCSDDSGEKSGDALVNGLKECLVNGAPLPEAGQEYLLFMSKSTGSRPEGTYELCMGYEYGMFETNSTGYLNENSSEAFTADELTAAIGTT